MYIESLLNWAVSRAADEYSQLFQLIYFLLVLFRIIENNLVIGCR